ncbi:PAS domain-containing protein [Nisaea acidiphila]|uniref:PAS domain-containing protein n=1 Tax=Nisaea acidiphila TaxID=1862145 RepID=A0A9J7ASF7_9PROT|nr:PAS domain-containing protein [Nisaea acidiphila]UUX50587.1 PAS domain-containing protein [Nisaea acidiphila]
MNTAVSDIVSEAEMTSPLIHSFYEFWKECCGDSPVPDREHFTPESLRPWIGHVQIVEVIDGGRDFYHRIIGTEIVEAVGRDLSRKYVSESSYGIGAEAMLERYRETAGRAVPVFRKGRMIWAPSNSWTSFESVTAPMGQGSDAVDQLITVIDYPGRQGVPEEEV